MLFFKTCRLYLILGEPVALSGQELLKAGKGRQIMSSGHRNEFCLNMLGEHFQHKGSQFLLDGSGTLRVQDLKGAKNNVLGVSAW